MSKRCLTKKIVCFGGGTALPQVVLSELKKYPVKITSLSVMLESGGSSGQLRIDFGILPSGDLRRQFLALSEAPQWKKELFRFRLGREIFDDGHKGHSFGNVFISGLEYILKDFKKVLKIIHEFLELKNHQVLPATIEQAHIGAVLENGELIFGEDEIDVPRKHNPKLKIKEVFLSKKVKAYPPVLNAIREADLITIGPGDLYSTIAPFFLIKGIPEAIRKSKAKKVFICPAMTKSGETQGFSASDFIKEIEKYLRCELDYAIYNNFMPSKVRIKNYKKEHPELLDLVKINADLPKRKFIGKNLLVSSGPIEYDSKKVVKTVLNLCKR